MENKLQYIPPECSQGDSDFCFAKYRADEIVDELNKIIGRFPEIGLEVVKKIKIWY